MTHNRGHDSSPSGAGHDFAPTNSSNRRTGPLAGLKVLEIESIGPGPFAAMLLADLGASVLRIERAARSDAANPNPVLGRGRCGFLQLDLKSETGSAVLIGLLRYADALIEGFRPGVMERLGLGPEVCHSHNPKLIYGRVTGWGRHGPLACSAGHDINYIALSGALYACGTTQSGPLPPLNLIGDFAGGGLLLAFGMVSALLECRSSGLGQVVDTAMLDGASLMMSMIYGYRAMGRWTAPRAGNMFDGSAYYYRCYACADDNWIAVGAIEPQFRAIFLEKLGLSGDKDAIMRSADDDPRVHARIAAIVRGHDRSHWQRVFEGTDACVAPVLSMDEAWMHPHNQEWGTFSRVSGFTQPSPAPRFSRTPLRQPEATNPDAEVNLSEWGLTSESLRAATIEVDTE
jgi:alpha-methylacyl-CoA racemase